MSSPSISIPSRAYEVNVFSKPRPEISSGDFPETWRFLPLARTVDGPVPAVAYKTDPAFKLAAEKYGRFTGYTVDGNATFTSERGKVTHATGTGAMGNGVADWATRCGKAVGIWPLDSDPQLVILDCDSDVRVVLPDETTTSVSWPEDVYRITYGIDQLVALAERFAEGERTIAPLIDGGHDKHCYFVFRQNPRLPIRRRLIRPSGLSFDVIGSGYQTHWTASPKRLVRGSELLETPPEFPLWLAKCVAKPVPVRTHTPPGTAHKFLDQPLASEGTLLRAYQDALLEPLDDIPHTYSAAKGTGWNEACYHAAWMLARAGMDLAWITREVRSRANPAGTTEDRKLAATIESAYQKAQEGL
jgi:hypothetical protein